VIDVNAKVEALFANGEWYSATVVGHDTATGTYEILFDDGVTQTGMISASVRDPNAKIVPAPVQEEVIRQVVDEPVRSSSPPIGRPKASPPKAVDVDARSLAATGGTVRVETNVDAQFSNGEWYSAKITAVNGDGTYDVLFDDGFSAPGTSAALIRDPNANQMATTVTPPIVTTSSPEEEIPIKAPSSPPLDDIPIGKTQEPMDEFPSEDDPGMNEEMAECAECGRKMRASALEKHMNVHKTRKKYNSKAHMVGKDARAEKKSAFQSGSMAGKAEKPKSKGAEQSKQLREAMKAQREYAKEQAAKKS